jgi:predicted Zn-dependent protease
MDSTSIYKCSISLNADRNAFNVNGSFSSTYLTKMVRHEVGHVLLLKHPSNLYFSSVMHQEAPNGSTISAIVTVEDRSNITAKWGP